MSAFRFLAIAAVLSATAMAGFICLFIMRNAPGFVAPVPIVGLGIVYTLAYSYAALRLAASLWSRKKGRPDASSAMVSRLLLPILVALLVYAFLESTVLDYYQPVSLFDDVIAALLATWCLLILVATVVFIRARSAPLEVLRRALLLCLLAVLGWPLAATLPWLNAAQPGQDVALHLDVFVGGEDGYDIYRIPGLLLLPRGATLASGVTLERDRLIAFAEARRDGALDTGIIDLVMKISDDGGSNWGVQQVVCRHQSEGMRGKCGNPTPVFDQQAGRILLAYNLSGITPSAAGGIHHSGHIIGSDDGGQRWGQPQQLTDDDLVFGPGHGIQKLVAPHTGRLVIPTYVSQHALVLYSDDHGQSWHRSETLNTGNETEVAELSDGRLYMTTRHRAPIGRPPEPNGRLYSTSTDGGASWVDAKTDTQLATPVCQASILRLDDDGGLLFANPSHHKARVRLTVQYSGDDGANWSRKTLVYPGPAGYSVLAGASNGDVLVLYERGTMAYSERISLARLPAEAL